MIAITNIALVGLGEVGAILAEDLAPIAELCAFDIRFTEPGAIASQNAARLGIRQSTSATENTTGAELIISAVTAAQILNAATAAAEADLKGAWFLDLNSASPGMKKEAAEAIKAAGGRYVEAAVMSPAPPKRLATPILLGGPHANDFSPLAEQLGLTNTSVFSAELGKASAAKMCRSVMVKGIEALLSESLLAARTYGVEDTVLKSLDDLFPGPDWPTLARYMISRTLEHGTRRAEEMREVARTISEAGLTPHMSAATAERQDWASQFNEALKLDQLEEMLDAISAMAAGRETAQ